jgi:peptidase E
MITFILHGGETSQDCPDNDVFFKDFTALVKKDHIKILLCYFARQRKEWNDLQARDSAKIARHTKKLVEYFVPQNSHELLSKINECDVLYVAGGKAELIEPIYDELKPLKEKLQNKIYIGSSMGAFMASTCYVRSFDSQDDRHVHKGLGLLPIQILCHWNIEQNKELKLKLLSENSDQPIVTLAETKFITIYQ